MNSKKIAEQIANLIFNKKGYDVKIIDLQKITSFSDYFLICSADSDTQVKAIADEIDEKLREEGIKYWHKEGMAALSWVLLDYVDVVVHIFKKESREFYNIEKLWGDAPVFDIQDPIEAKKEIVKPKTKTVKKTTVTKSKKIK
ncbi:MAG: ribosome silencing factor [Ignavibacterium sp.]|nr:MAG: ribosome silencing factor [Ignavibacterium sp.]